MTIFESARHSHQNAAARALIDLMEYASRASIVAVDPESPEEIHSAYMITFGAFAAEARAWAKERLDVDNQQWLESALVTRGL